MHPCAHAVFPLQQRNPSHAPGCNTAADTAAGTAAAHHQATKEGVGRAGTSLGARVRACGLG